MKNLTHVSASTLPAVSIFRRHVITVVPSPHWHEEYAIGLITGGVEQFEYRRATHRVLERSS